MLKTVLVASSVLAFAAFGCAASSHRNPDWRNPRPCASDDPDCKSLPALPPAPGTDGGARPPAPAPSIQGAPGDIQI